MKVAILFPRLDCSFKEGPVPTKKGPIEPIREHWKNFLNALFRWHHNRGDDVVFIEKAMWQFDLEFVKDIARKYDVVYMGHRNKFNFDAGDNVLYFHQTVFPELFTIDHKGVCAHASWSPLNWDLDYDMAMFYRMQRRVDANETKFDQPKRRDKLPFKKNHILFVCQLPHDEVIRYSSDISVLDALSLTVQLGHHTNTPVVVKGHPVNPGSMEPLRGFVEIMRKDRGCDVTWVDAVSIHDCLASCKVAVMVNSGVGIEAILHEKPVIHFGRAEYDLLFPRVSNFDELYDAYQKGKRLFNTKKAVCFLNTYVKKKCYDSTRVSTFDKLEKILANI